MTDIPYIPRPYRYVMSFMGALAMHAGWSPRCYLEQLVRHLELRVPMEDDA